MVQYEIGMLDFNGFLSIKQIFHVSASLCVTKAQRTVSIIYGQCV